MIKYNSDNKIFTSTLLSGANYISGFSTSPVGDSRNITIIANFLKINNISADKIIIPKQIHSTNLEYLDANLATEKIKFIEDTDGIITNLSRTVLVARTADCIPLIIVDKKTGLIGISHQGWRGSLKNMAEKMVSRFLNLQSNISDLHCAIGPSIGACCYEIDNELSYDFLSEYEEYAKQIILYKKAKPHLSLNHLNYLQLIKTGINKQNIDFFPFCTKCDSDRFFSRRRSKSNDFGEMFSFVFRSK